MHKTPSGAHLKTCCPVGAVRAEQYVVERPQGAVLRQRLHLAHIQGGALDALLLHGCMHMQFISEHNPEAE